MVEVDLTREVGVRRAVRRWPERDAHRLALLAPHGGKIRWEPRPLE